MLTKGNTNGKGSQWNRTIIVASTCVFFGLLYILFAGEQGAFFSSSSMLESDRSSYYNVKVVPHTLSDVELAGLPPTAFSYIAMVDAGSSGCRAHVYRYGKLGQLSGQLYILPQHQSKKVNPGLSSFADHPEDAGKSLQGLIDFMKEQVPEPDWGTTPFFLKATAGLRMLPDDKREAILNSVRTFMSDPAISPFLFHDSWAKVIPGNEEGGFGWLAYNYLMKLVGPKKKDGAGAPYAVVEMGGASAQVSQMAVTAEQRAAIPTNNLFAFDIEGEQFTLFTHSYLGYGAEQARTALNNRIVDQYNKNGASGPVQDPCLNEGFKVAAGSKVGDVYQGPEESGKYGAVGSSNEKVCATEVAAALFPATADSSKCQAAAKPFGCVTIPDFVRNSANFMAFENFYYTASGVGVTPAGTAGATKTKQDFPLTTTPSNFATASGSVCKESWTALGGTYPVDGQDKDKNVKWCFAASYMSAFLLDGMKLDPNKQITVTKEVDGSEVEWALGAAYKEAAELLKRSHLRPAGISGR